MPEVLPYASPAPQSNRDDLLYLKTLAIIHYVLGGLGAFGATMSLIATVVDPESRGPITVMLVYSLAMIFSGFCLTTRRFRHFSVILLVPLWLMFPIGTILGIYTLRILGRPSIIALYHAGK